MKLTTFLKATGVAVAMGMSQASMADESVYTLPDYKAAAGVSGNLSSIGSDTLANLMTFWAEAL